MDFPFQYTIDPSADSPIMLIDRHIGYDKEDGYGIMGDAFSRELLYLDTLGKSKIQVWINSVGGSVSDGEQIISTILKTKTKVDTHNIGMAASIAGAIFLSGRDRYMMDYAKFMMHPVSGGDLKMRAAFEESVVKMLSGRINVEESEVRAMMNQTTWLNAEQCEAIGMCKVESSAEYNRKPRKPLDVSNIAEAYAECKYVVNSLLNDLKPKNKQMNKVTNKLGLVDNANEESILNAIATIENRAKVAEEALNTLNGEKTALQGKLADLEAYKNKIESEAKAKAEAEEAANKAAHAQKVKNTVADYVKAGKIENKAEVIEAEEALASVNLEAYVKVKDAQPVNKVAPKSITGKVENEGDVVPQNAAVIMANIAKAKGQVK